MRVDEGVGVYELVLKHRPRYRALGVGLPNCFLCEFGMPDDPYAQGHGFWEELWPYLEQKGIDSAKFRQELLAATRTCANSAYGECAPFMREEFMRKVRWAAGMP